MADIVIIADDHPLFREGLRRIVQLIVSAQVIEVANTKALHVEAEKNGAPIAMFLDLVFPGFKGAESIAELRTTYPHSALIVVSMTEDQELADGIIAAGANGYIAKSVTAGSMQHAIRRILNGEIIIHLDDSDFDATQKSSSQLDALPQRHIDVLVQLGQGKTNKEIARELGISPLTVRTHMTALFRSLGVTTRSAAAAFAVRNGLA